MRIYLWQEWWRLLSLCMLLFAGCSLCLVCTLVCLRPLRPWSSCGIMSDVPCVQPAFHSIIFLCVYLRFSLHIVCLAYISSYTCVFVFAFTNTCLLATLFTCALVSTKHISLPPVGHSFSTVVGPPLGCILLQRCHIHPKWGGNHLGESIISYNFI